MVPVAGGCARPKKRVCSFCIDKVESIDYKDVNKLRRYLSERGKIIPRRISVIVQSLSKTAYIGYKRARNIACYHLLQNKMSKTRFIGFFPISSSLIFLLI